MNNLVKLAQEQLECYEKQLFYLKTNLNTIYEFCLLAELEFKDNKNELEKYKLKMYLKDIKKILEIFQGILL